jgi:hypothetical protein
MSRLTLVSSLILWLVELTSCSAQSVYEFSLQQRKDCFKTGGAYYGYVVGSGEVCLYKNPAVK